MKSAVATIALLLFVTGAPLLAQERDIQFTVWASQVEMQGENDFDGFETDFDDGTAMGLSANWFVGRFVSVEGSVFNLRNDAALTIDPTLAIDLGTVRLTPFMLGAQVHLAGRSRIDPYIGGGAAYVVARDLFTPDLEAGGVGRIELDNQLTYYLNAGIGFQIAGGFGIVIDGRYIPFETDSRSTVTGVEQELELQPQILSLGLRLRF